MSGLNYALVAKNTKDDMLFMVNKQDDGTVSICLAGKYEGEEMQIDFNDLSVKDARDLARYIEGEASRPVHRGMCNEIPMPRSTV